MPYIIKKWVNQFNNLILIVKNYLQYTSLVEELGMINITKFKSG